MSTKLESAGILDHDFLGDTLGIRPQVDETTEREITSIGERMLAEKGLKRYFEQRRSGLFELLENRGESRQLPVWKVRIWLDDLANRCFKGSDTDWHRHSLQVIERSCNELFKVTKAELCSSIAGYIPDAYQPRTAHRMSDIDLRQVDRFNEWFDDCSAGFSHSLTIAKLRNERMYQVDDRKKKGFQGVHDPREYALDEFVLKDADMSGLEWSEIANIVSIYGLPNFSVVKN